VEGVDEGFSLWDWLVIAVGAVFILQALFRLNASRSARPPELLTESPRRLGGRGRNLAAPIECWTAGPASRQERPGPGGDPNARALTRAGPG
jgi:hypothetical protein